MLDEPIEKLLIEQIDELKARRIAASKLGIDLRHITEDDKIALNHEVNILLKTAQT